MTYEDFKKLVEKYCREDTFSKFSDGRREKAITQAITENESVIKERYEGLVGAFGDNLDFGVCKEHAGDLAYLMRFMW